MVKKLVSEDEINRKIRETLIQYFKPTSDDWKTMLSDNMKYILIERIEKAMKHPEMSPQEREWLRKLIEVGRAEFVFRNKGDEIIQFDISLDQIFRSTANRIVLNLQAIDDKIEISYMKNVFELFYNLTLFVDFMITVAISRFETKNSKDGFSMRRARAVTYLALNLIEQENGTVLYERSKGNLSAALKSIKTVLMNIDNPGFIQSILVYKTLINEHHSFKAMLESLEKIDLPEVRLPITIKA